MAQLAGDVRRCMKEWFQGSGTKVVIWKGINIGICGGGARMWPEGGRIF